MTTNPIYDAVVVGGGQAGIPLALALARAGRRVALAEQKDMGGSCVNFGCTPTKAAIASARVTQVARRAASYGVSVGDVRVDFPRVLQRAREIAGSSRVSLEHTLSGEANIELYRGHARLLGRDGDHLRVLIERRAGTAEDVEIRTRDVILDTGTRSSIPSIEGLADVNPLCSENWVDREDLPAHLLVIGGGYIGLEMAQFYRRMGSSVTVVQAVGQIAEREDPEIANKLQELLAAEGIHFHLKTKVSALRQRNGGIAATLETERNGEGSSAQHEIEVSHVFVASGRIPNTDSLGLETLGVERDKAGFIRVDERLATSVPGVWAVGDIRGGPMFTHTSWDDYRIVESQMLGDRLHTLDRIVPYAVFTDPELARVGITESEARASGLDVKVGCFELRNNGKARELGETEGLIKVIIDADSDKLRGAALLCFEASELVHAYVGLMNAKVPAKIMTDAIHIHPTLAEALQSAISAAK